LNLSVEFISIFKYNLLYTYSHAPGSLYIKHGTARFINEFLIPPLFKILLKISMLYRAETHEVVVDIAGTIFY